MFSKRSNITRNTTLYIELPRVVRKSDKFVTREHISSTIIAFNPIPVIYDRAIPRQRLLLTMAYSSQILQRRLTSLTFFLVASLTGYPLPTCEGAVMETTSPNPWPTDATCKPHPYG